MTTTTRRVGAVAMAAMLALTLGAGTALAAPTVDSEATNTASSSALNDGDTIDSFNASDTNISTLQVNYDTSNPGIKIIDPDSGETIKYVTNESDPGYFTVTDSTNNYYNTTFQESDFAAMPMDAGENKSVTLRLIGNTSADSPTTTNITIYLNNTNERAVVYAGDAAESGDAPTTSLDVENESTWGGFGDEIEQATVEHDNLGISGADTTVYVVYAEDNASDAYTAAPDRALWGEYSDGEFIASQQVWVEGQPHAVYQSDVPDVVNTDVTHGVTTTVDGYDAVEVEVGDHYDDDDSVDVEAHANDKYRLDRAFGVQQDAEGTLNALSPLSVGGVGAGQLEA